MQMSEKGSFELNYSTWLKFIESIGTISPECRLHITKKEISAIVVDTANVSMVSSTIDATGFTKTPTGDAVLGIDISAIHTMIKPLWNATVDPEISVKISWCGGKHQPLLYIDFNGIQSVFETMDTKTIRKDPNPPQITLETEFVANGTKLQEAFGHCGKISDKCQFRVMKDGLCYIAAQGEKHQCKIGVATDGNGQATAEYSLDYLKDISKVFAGSAVEVRLKTDHPVSFSFSPFPGISVQYILAPRVEAEPGPEWLL